MYPSLESAIQQFDPGEHNGLLVPIRWLNRGDLLYPLPPDWWWSSLYSLINTLEIRRPIVHSLPFLYQLEPMIATVAQDCKVPLVNSPAGSNANLRALATEIGVDLIITSPDRLLRCFELVADVPEPPKAFLVIHDEPGYLEPAFHTIEVFHELHFFPGASLAFQIDQTGKKLQGNQFFLTDTLVWDQHTDGVVNTVSSGEKFSLPFSEKTKFEFKPILHSDTYALTKI